MKSGEKKSYYPKSSLKDYITKSIELLFGLALFGVGVYITVQANVGLAPWAAFSIGFSNVTGVNYGIVTVVVSLAIVALDLLLKEKVGWGTVGDAVLIGLMITALDTLGVMPLIEDFRMGIVWMLIGILISAVASFFYMDAAFGCGPRDALMVALCRLLPNVPVGIIRIMLEGTALLIGWLLGAKVGIGTLIYVLGIGAGIELVFRIARFDATRVKHEDLLDTHRNLMKVIREEKRQ